MPGMAISRPSKLSAPPCVTVAPAGTGGGGAGIGLAAPAGRFAATVTFGYFFFGGTGGETTTSIGGRS
jgi:hypothetical protein